MFAIVGRELELAAEDLHVERDARQRRGNGGRARRPRAAATRAASRRGWSARPIIDSDTGTSVAPTSSAVCIVPASVHRNVASTAAPPPVITTSAIDANTIASAAAERIENSS